MNNYTEFGAEARKIMLIKGISMAELADELGCSVAYVSDIFKGARNGTRQKPKIAEFLGMESEVLKHDTR